MNSDQARNASAFLILAAHGMAGSFRGDHNNIDIFWRHNLAVMNIETVRERKRHAFFQVRFNILAVKGSLLFVVDEYHDDIGFLNRVGGKHNFEPGILCEFSGF